MGGVGPSCGKVNGRDGDMIAWIIAGDRVLILDTEKLCLTYLLESHWSLFKCCYFHAIMERIILKLWMEISCLLNIILIYIYIYIY